MRLLALDGGGGRGAITLEILSSLEARLGGPVAGYADMISGTSTGGIMAAALASGVPAAKLSELYADGIPKIFNNGWKRRVATLWGLRDQKYPSTGLETLLREVLGDAKMSDCQTRLLVPAWDLMRCQLKWFRSWDPADQGRLLRDVAQATASAPTYFEPHQGFVDGGVVANSPAYRAYVEARRVSVGGRAADFSLLSIGTGVARSPVDPDAASGWGVGSWARVLVNIMLGGQGAEAHDVLSALFDAGGAKDNYVRVQADLSGFSPEIRTMDSRDRKVIETWQAIGRYVAEDHAAELDRVAAEWKKRS